MKILMTFSKSDTLDPTQNFSIDIFHAPFHLGYI